MDLNLFDYYYIYSQIDEYEQEQKRKKSEESLEDYLKHASESASEHVPETIQDPTHTLAYEDLPGIFRITLCLLYVIYKAFAFVITAVGGILSLLFIIMILQWLLF